LVLPGWKLFYKDFSLPGIAPNAGIAVVGLGGPCLCSWAEIDDELVLCGGCCG